MRPPDPVTSKLEESRREDVDEDENVGRDSKRLEAAIEDIIKEKKEAERTNT